MSSVGGSPGRCFLNTSTTASSSRVVVSLSSVFWMNGRVVEELEQVLVRVQRQPVVVVLTRERAQERRHRQLPLPVDAGVDDALLVDLELEPRAAARHQVRGEDLLRRVLRLHQVGARTADELRHDHALGAVDDERAPLRHHREVAHEDPLLADLAGLLVDEADRHRERGLIGQVLLTALLDREAGVAELEVAELHRERAGVVLDRRDVGNGLSQSLVLEPLERRLLDVDQVGEVEDVLQTRKALTRAGRDSSAAQVVTASLMATGESVSVGRCGTGGTMSAEPRRVAQTGPTPQARAAVEAEYWFEVYRCAQIEAPP